MITLFKNANLIDGISEELRPGCNVLVVDGVIAEVSEKPICAKADEEIDCTGKYLLPGLTNLHVHLHRRHNSRGTKLFSAGAGDISALPNEGRILYAMRNAWYELSFGTTTIRDLTSQGRVANELRDYFNTGVFNGPRMITCGLGLACTGGHGCHVNLYDAREADGPGEVMKCVREEIKYGAQFIKMMASGGLSGMKEGEEHPDWCEYTLEEFQAGCAAAHSHHKTVTVHAMGELPPLTALKGGVDGIEHGTKLNDEAIAIMKERGCYFVPTMSGITTLANREYNTGDKKLGQEIFDVVVNPQRESVRKAIKAGILIGTGTDTLGNLYLEMELLEECGMTPMQALKAATSNAGKIIEMPDTVGCVGEGYSADLLLVNSNPLESIENLKQVAYVMCRGSHVTHEWMCNLQ